MTNNTFMRMEEVAQVLGVSISYAYKIIQKLNAEMRAMDYFTISGQSTGTTSWSGSNKRDRRESDDMSVYKEEKKDTWRVIYRYTDSTE